MSGACASRILRTQADLPQGCRRSLTNLRRFKPAQTFCGFAESGEGCKVDVLADFLPGFGSDGTTEAMPPLVVRIVKEQRDDLLVGWPDLKRLGMDQRW